MSGFGRSEGQHLGLLDLRQRLYLGENVLRYAAVDLDQRDGIATLAVTAEIECRDVEAGITKQARELADETGLVLVRDVDHRLTELGIDTNTLDVDKARLTVGVNRARHRTLLPLGKDGDRDQAFVVAL